MAMFLQFVTAYLGSVMFQIGIFNHSVVVGYTNDVACDRIKISIALSR